MATLNLNPMFTSMKGKMGGIILYNRKGVLCARTRVIPRNPDTPEQRRNRGAFADAVRLWQLLPPSDKEKFNRKAFRRRMCGYNFFISEYMKKHSQSIRSMPVVETAYKMSIESDPLRLIPDSHCVIPVSMEFTDSLRDFPHLNNPG